MFEAGGPSKDIYLEWILIEDSLEVTYTDEGHFVAVSMIDHVNLKSKLMAGKISDVLKVKTIFKSKVLEDIQKQLESKKKDQCLVMQGLPGIGKSTACWASCCMKSCSDASANFVFAYFYQGLVRGVIHLQGGGKVTEAAYVQQHQHPNVEDIIMSLKHRYPSAQLVLDGVHQEDARHLAVNSMGWITVASVGLEFKGDAFNNSDGLLVRLELDSWTLDEFEKAVDRVIIDDEVLKFDREFLGMENGNTPDEKFQQEWVHERYFISGGSARLMFGGNAEWAMCEIDRAFALVSDLDALFANVTGPRSQGDVSRLRQRIEKNYTFLSPYVIRSLSSLESKMKTTLNWDVFVSSAKEVAKNVKNEAFKGWVHEFDFLVKLYPAKEQLLCKKLALELHPVSDNAPAQCRIVELEVERVVRFQKESDLSGLLSSQDHNVLAWPQSFKQGTYDAAFVCFLDDKTPVIITMQATVSTTHSFKPAYISKLINQLADCPAAAKDGKFKLWHVFVLENEPQLQNFTFTDCKEVGIRETRHNKEQAWAIQPVFWKTNLNVS